MDFDTLKVIVVLIRIFFVLLEVLGVCVGAFAKVGDYLVFEGAMVLATGVGRGRGRGGG